MAARVLGEVGIQPTAQVDPREKKHERAGQTYSTALLQALKIGTVEFPENQRLWIP